MVCYGFTANQKAQEVVGLPLPLPGSEVPAVPTEIWGGGQGGGGRASSDEI